MTDDRKTTDQRTQLDHEDDRRARELICEADLGSGIGYTCDYEKVLLAYQCVLLKDVRFALNELLAYKQAEVHR